jgi:hypothetical protein
VALLVERVTKVKAPKKRVLRQLGGTRQVAAPVCFGESKTQELVPPAVGVAPNPPVQRAKDSVERMRPYPHGAHDTQEPPRRQSRVAPRSSAR